MIPSSQPSSIPILGICAYASGVGKTTLLTQLIPALNAKGVRVSVIKHAHHRFDIDQPGKDSYRIRESGAVQMLIASNRRWALMTELDHTPDDAQSMPDLAMLIQQIDPALADLILVEGFKQAPIAKIEVHRPSLQHPLLASQDSHIIAIATDTPMDCAAAPDLPILNLNHAGEVAAFINTWLTAQKTPPIPPTEHE